jgi:F-type H+-transporting ATPase subunit b
MIHNLTHFAAEAGEASGIGALGINGKALIIQLLTFLVAYLVLRRFAFKPILKVLAERRELIESGVSLGEEMKKERAELDDKITAELHDARKKADGIVAEAHDAAKAAVAEAEEKARAKADSITADAHARAEQERARLKKELEKEVIGWVSDATEAIIDEKVDAKKDAALIDKALKGAKT